MYDAVARIYSSSCVRGGQECHIFVRGTFGGRFTVRRIPPLPPNREDCVCGALRTNDRSIVFFYTVNPFIFNTPAHFHLQETYQAVTHNILIFLSPEGRMTSLRDYSWWGNAQKNSASLRGKNIVESLLRL